MQRLHFLAFLFCYPAAVTACNPAAHDLRLQAYCYLAVYTNTIIPSTLADHIDRTLRSIGNADGIGRDQYVPIFQRSISLRPTLEYDNNINGGNPEGPLVLGDLTFFGDDSLVRVAGALVGLNLNVGGRYLYGEGSYLDYSVGSSYAYSPDHGLGIFSSSLSFCNVTLLTTWTYLDVCAMSSKIQKDLLDSETDEVSLAISKFRTFDDSTLGMVGIELSRYINNNQPQYRVSLEQEVITKDGVVVNLDLMVGEPLDGLLATTFSLNSTAALPVSNRFLEIGLQFSEASGGYLLGISRSDRSILINASYQLSNWLEVGIGYSSVDSTIDYYDEDVPFLSIGLPAIRF
jgi:hypothetical protein